MKICFILPEYLGFGGGIKTFYQELIASLPSTYQYHILVGSGCVSSADSHAKSISPNILIRELSSYALNEAAALFNRYSIWPMLQKDLAASWCLRKMAEEWKPDIVEIADYGLLYSAWLLPSEIPWLVQCHGSNAQLLKYDPIHGMEAYAQISALLEAAILPSIPFLVASNSINKKEWEEATGKSNIVVLEPPWSSKSKNSSLGIQEPHALGPCRVFGRFQYWKGALTTAAALEILGDSAPVVEWYGRNMPHRENHLTTSDEVRRLYPDILGSKLLHKDQVCSDRVKDLQASALFNLIPSNWDVLNFSLIEAMASGRPVLASNKAGASSLIDHGVNGLIFDAQNENSLAQEMMHLLSMSEQDRLRMAAEAQKTISERLDPSKQVEKRLVLYTNIMKQWATILQNKSPLWLQEAIEPRNDALRQPRGTLDQLPLRELSKYLFSRFKKKLLN